MASSVSAAKKSPLVIVFLTIFIDLVGFGIIIPQSPYFARQFGATPTEVGFMMAIYSGLQFLAAPFWGRLSDRIGRRPVLLISLFGSTFSHFIFYLAPNLWILYLARGLAGLFGANISAASAIIADLTPANERSKGMGLIGAAFGLGFILGPTISGFVSQWNETYPPLAASVICGFNFLLALWWLPETLNPENRASESKTGRLKRIAKHISSPVVGVMMFAFFLTGFSMANMEAPLFLLVKDRFEFDVVRASFAFAYIGIWIAITQGFLIRKILPRYGEKKLLLVGLAMFALGLFGIGFSEYVWLLGLSVTLLAIGSGFTNPSIMGSVSLLTPPHEQGEVMGVLQSLAALARIVGPPIGGWLYGSITIGTPFYLAAGTAFFAWLLMFLNKSRLPEKGRQ